MDILYEDNHLLAINKPTGIATMGAPSDTRTMVTLAKQYIRHKYQKTGNVYLGVVSRLDKPVSGILLLARTSKAAARLNRLFIRRDVRKSYWAIVSPQREIANTGRFEDWLRKNESHRRMEVCEPTAPGSQQAILSFVAKHRISNRAWVEIDLQTGRKHQIRVQFAAHGCPIVGDQKYGSCETFPQGIALHARMLKLTHPVRQVPLEIVAPLPRSWPAIPQPPRHGNGME